MALNQKQCVVEYIGAMIKTIKREKEKEKKSNEPEAPLPSISEKEREEHLQKAMTPFGEAFYTIITKHAETFSNRNVDQVFWIWVDEVQKWLVQQQKVNNALKQWIQNSQPNNRDTLLNALNEVRPLPQAPTTLRGKIQ